MVALGVEGRSFSRIRALVITRSNQQLPQTIIVALCLSRTVLVCLACVASIIRLLQDLRIAAVDRRLLLLSGGDREAGLEEAELAREKAGLAAEMQKREAECVRLLQERNSVRPTVLATGTVAST